MGAQTFTGIDLGSESIKCVVISGTKGKMRVESCHTEKLNVTQGEGGSNWHDAASAVLTQWRKDNIIGDAPVCINAPAHDTLIRALKVNADISEQELQNVINEQLPFDLEIIEYDDAIVGETDGQNQIIVTAAKKTIISDVLDICDEAGVAVKSINAASIASGNLLLHAGGGKVEAPTAILDLGCAASSLTIVEREKIWVRSLPINGKAIVDALVKELNTTDVDAHDTLMNKVQLAGAADESDAATASVRKTLTRLVMEITRSLTFYRAQFDGEKPEKITVTGDYSGIPGLVNFLEDRAKTPTDTLNVFAGMEGGTEADAPLYAAAVGLALQNAGAAEYALTLIPRDIQSQRSLNKKKPWVIAAVFILAVAFAGLFVNAKIKTQKVQAENEAVYEQLEKVQKFDKELSGLQSTLNAQLEKDKELQRLLWERDLYSYILEKVAEKLPHSTLPGYMWLYGLKNETFGTIYDAEVAMADADSGFGYTMIEDEKVLDRTVRVIIKGGYYGTWQGAMEKIINNLKTIPGIVKVEQKGLTTHKKYTEMDLALDIDIDRNGTADSIDIKNTYMPQGSRR